MTLVELRIHKALDGDSVEHGAFVDVRAIGESGRSRLVQRVSAPVGENASLTRALHLDPGRYEFSAMLPSGSVLSEMVDVDAAASSIQVALEAGTSPHEWLAWQQWSGNVSDSTAFETLRAGLSQASTLVNGALGDVSAELWWSAVDETSQSPDRVWARLSERLSVLEAGQNIDPETLRGIDYTVEPIALLPDPPYVAARLPAGRIGGPTRAFLIVRQGSRNMLCAMPWPWQQVDRQGEALVEAVIAVDEELIDSPAVPLEVPDVEPVWSVRPTVRDRLLGGMLAFFGSGEQAVARELLGPARTLLFEKMTNPFGAAGGAHILVTDWITTSSPVDPKRGSVSVGDAPADWMRWISNLSQRFPWLPDGAILEGWLALRRRDQEPRVDEARRAFLEAERRGVPIYTVGVRRLVDGLLLLAGEMQRRGTLDAEVDSALIRARRLAWQIDPRQPFTCVRLWSS